MRAIAVDLIGLHVETATGAPLLLLREHDLPHRVLPIFIGEAEAASIAFALSGELPPRPLTHDLMAALVTSLEVHVDSVEVTDVVDGAFTAALTLSGPTGGHRLDTRPSDAIALAVRLGTPLFVRESVLDEAGSVVEESSDDGDDEVADDISIDQEVADFRSFLDTLDPDDFGAAPGAGGAVDE
ncbi:MAG: bifunctional nuclease family protein [Acidimicrobiales bacterium]